MHYTIRHEKPTKKINYENVISYFNFGDIFFINPQVLIIKEHFIYFPVISDHKKEDTQLQVKFLEINKNIIRQCFHMKLT